MISRPWLIAHERTRVLRRAAQALDVKPMTIVSAPSALSGGGLHDFYSEADYWWPNPARPQGPYRRNDGLKNPACFETHRHLLIELANAFPALVLAFEITGDPDYVRAALRYLDAWFVSSQTRMAPHFRFAQAVRGVCDGRSFGLIDAVHLCEVALAFCHLRELTTLPSELDKAVTVWFGALLTWMTTHPFGLKQMDAANNHGSAWTLEAACFARVVQDGRMLESCRKRLQDLHLPEQMAENGSFPREMLRNRAYNYSWFNLDILSALATHLSSPQSDLMRWSLSDGRSLLRGIEFMFPFIADKSSWPKPPDVILWEKLPVRSPALLFGARAAGRRAWLEAWMDLEPDPDDPEVQRNFPIRQPLLWL